MGLKKLPELIASPKLSLALMATLAGFLFLASEGRSVLYSPVFTGIVLVLWFNLTFCTLRQFKFRRKSSPGPPGKWWNKGRWGSQVLHGGLVMIVSGALLQYALGFSGIISLPEGGAFTGRIQEYLILRKGFLASHDLGGVEFFLQQLRIRPQAGKSDGEGLVVLVRNGELVKQQWLAKGHPFSAGIINLYFNYLGYVVNIEYLGRDGSRDIYPAKLTTVSLGNGEEYTGSFRITDSDYIMDLRFIPGSDPAVVVGLRGDGAAQGKALDREAFKQEIPIGSQVELPNGDRLVIHNFVPWLGMAIKKEPGLYIIYGGLILTVLGMFMLYAGGPGSRYDSIREQSWEV